MLDQHLIVSTHPEALPENIVLWKNDRITVLTEALFRVEEDASRIFCDQATQAVWFRNLPPVEFETEEKDGTLHIRTKRAELVMGETWEDSYVLLEGRRTALDGRESSRAEELTQDDSGEDVLYGTYRTLDCCDGDFWIPYNMDMTQAHRIQLNPGILSRKGAAVLDDSASLLLGEDGQIRIRDRKEKDIYVFAYGHAYREAIRAFYAICGPVPRVPRFALGNWWSRYHAYTEKEYLHTMDSLAEQDLPFTVATVDMDWHWSETLDEVKQITAQGKNDAFHGGNSGWTGYSWNTNLFPDYRRFLRKLHDRGLRVTLNLHPADGVRYFEDSYRKMAVALGVDPDSERQIPFNIADPAFINAYFKILHKPYEKDGVDFWWIDWQQGSNSALEGLDPLWALNHYHYLDNGQEHGEHDPLILSRYCGAGAHRYPLGFSGDTFVTWKTLAFLPYFTATASNIGYTWWSHDIGGHMGGIKDDELYVRSLQFGVFSPILRLHSTSQSTFTKEPWAYRNGTGLVAGKFLQFRHRLIPYLYSASCITAEEGRALIEPLYYEWPEAEEAYAFRNEYLFGSQLLAAPVTSSSVEGGMAETEVWLPEGRWTDIFTGEEYRGGRTLTMVRWLDSIPVLAREGAILVLDDRKHTNSVENPDKLEVRSYCGNGSYVLQEEGKGGRIRTAFVSWEEEAGDGSRLQKLSFHCETWEETSISENREAASSCGKGTAAPSRDYRIVFPNIPEGEVSVRAEGYEGTPRVDDNGYVSVILPDVPADARVEVSVCYREREKEKRLERIRKSLTCFEMDNWEKEALYWRLWSALEEDYSRIIQESGLSEMAKKRLMELL